MMNFAQKIITAVRSRYQAGVIPGVASSVLFAWALTLVDIPAAGRAYAAYGGDYITAALLWLWAVEGVRPDSYDLLGAGSCLVGAGMILLAPRPV